MNTKAQSAAAFPAFPVLATGGAAIAGVVLLAVDQPALGVFASLIGLGLSFPLWLRELGQRDAHWKTRMAAELAAQAPVAAPSAMPAGLSRLQSEWFPGLENQLMAVRNQVESAASDAGHALSRVRERLQEVERMADESAQAMGASGSGVADEVRGRLSDMLDNINRSLDEKVAMFDEVRGFVNATDELARMASSVEELAAKTNLLALNAAIEAARAGEEGRGFSIVADEVRKLSMLSAETGQQIRQRVADISAAARRAGEGADRMQGSDSRLLQQAKGTIGEIVDSFSRAADPLQASARQMADQAGQTLREVDEAESSLGIHANVDASIAAIDSSLKSLRGQMASGSDIDVSAVMRPLSERAYSAPAQRPAPAAARRPAAPVAADRSPPASSNAGGGGVDITFF